MRAGVLYRVARGVAWVLARGLFRFRIELEGAEHLPTDASGAMAGGWIAAAAPHRRWIDPFLLMLLLPASPRPVFLGDGRTLRRSWLRRLLFGALGGVVPVDRGSGVRGFAGHVAAAREVTQRGGVFVIFPEAGPPSEAGRSRRLEPGVAYLSLRTGAPIIPIAIGGNDELYRGRRLIVRILPAIRPAEAVGDRHRPGTPAERDAARALTSALGERMQRAIASVHARVDLTSVDDVKRWRWLSDWIS
jgi:1-acyl-sn-glycerol-3-phosphate acyltransferase